MTPAGLSSATLPAPRRRAVPAAVSAAPVPDVRHQAQIAARELQEYLRENGHNLRFTVDEASGMTVVRIYNTSTGELVRQIPTEEVVHLAAILRQEAGRSTLSLRA
jgi:uncharacterized FlaG/YvyC family protein